MSKRMPRTTTDFSKHELTIKKDEYATIYDFKKLNTITERVVFINCMGILTVTGDYGNYVFCREFHPAKDGYVSDMYWVEKATISSKQEVMKFDEEETLKAINHMLDNPDEDSLDQDDKNYLEELKNQIYDGYERYIVYAMDNIPESRDFEFPPIKRTIDFQLQIVFDAFEEVCHRMPKEN